MKVPLILSLALSLVGFAFAQETPYRINIHKEYGYNTGNHIRGAFSVSVIGEMERIVSVTFLIDGNALGKISHSPYQLRFKTQDFSVGTHELAAIVDTDDGSSVTTPGREFEFVSAEMESAELQRIITPLLGGIILLVVLAAVFQWFYYREKPLADLPLGEHRYYGLSGGTICPKCQRPFALHWWAPNLCFHKYDRCENCGRWSLVKRLRSEDLAAAETAEAHILSGYHGPEDRAEVNQRLDDTRFVDKI